MKDILDGVRKKKLKKKSIDIEGDVAEVEVAANSNEKRKNVGEVAREDISKRGFTTLTLIVEDSDSMASKTESESPTDTPPSPPNKTKVYLRRGAKGKSEQRGGSAILTQPEEIRGGITEGTNGDGRVLEIVPKNVYKDPDDGRQRFLLELEFVQCLANPTYIHYLAQNRYFEDEAFIGYLKYLQYWQRPEYIKFIMYPHCLYFLELLQNANFRNAMAHPTNKELAHRQQFYFWKNYRNNRLKHILPKPLPEPTAALPASTQPQPPVPALPPPPPPPAATNVAVTTSSTQAPSPMPYGSGLAKNDPRNPTVDRRKRK
ncbi:Mediator of RNA polymerase II transcription subunit 31 [Trifolium repens]|nr:Mediator of RNA polymerase II transcription subunit 31 [Trifolium repens]